MSRISQNKNKTHVWDAHFNMFIGYWISMVLILFLPLFQEGNVGTFILPRKKLRRCDMAETGLSVRIWFIWTLGRWDFFKVFVEFKVSLYTKGYTSRGDLDILWNCLVEYHHNSVSIRRSYWNIFKKKIIFLPKSYMSFVFWTFIFIICYLMFHYQIILVLIWKNLSRCDEPP